MTRPTLEEVHAAYLRANDAYHAASAIKSNILQQLIHEEREQGTPLRTMAQRYGVPKSSLQRIARKLTGRDWASCKGCSPDAYVRAHNHAWGEGRHAIQRAPFTVENGVTRANGGVAQQVYAFSVEPDAISSLGGLSEVTLGPGVYGVDVAHDLQEQFLCISGTAGAGKTVLAKNLVRQLALKGNRVEVFGMAGWEGLEHSGIVNVHLFDNATSAENRLRDLVSDVGSERFFVIDTPLLSAEFVRELKDSGLQGVYVSQREALIPGAAHVRMGFGGSAGTGTIESDIPPAPAGVVSTCSPDDLHVGKEFYSAPMLSVPSCGLTEVVLGETKDGIAVHDFKSGHLCVVGGPWTGKTVLAKSIARQMVAKGHAVDVIDAHRAWSDVEGTGALGVCSVTSADDVSLVVDELVARRKETGYQGLHLIVDDASLLTVEMGRVLRCAGFRILSGNAKALSSDHGKVSLDVADGVGRGVILR